MTPDELIQPVISEPNSDPNSFQNNLVSLIRQADYLHAEAHELTLSLARPGSQLNALVGQVPFGLEGISCAMYFLNGAINSLLSLRLMTIEAIIDTPQGQQLLVRLTPHGTAGLLRQTLECAAKAHWIMHAPTLEQFNIRSFAALWENGQQSVSYAYAIGSTDLEAKKAVFDELASDGLSRGLVEIIDNKVRVKRSIFPAADILRMIHFRERRFDHLISILGSNVHSGVWMYSWLSGMAHGLVWSHADTPYQESGNEIDVVTTAPDVMRLGLSAALAIEIIEDIFESFTNPLFDPVRR